MQIGVFDSGKGGHFVAERLATLLPDCRFVVVDDSANVPYGSRPRSEVIELTDRAIQPLLATCPIIVIACNTATTAGIQTLRERYPDTHFVGIEPMIKPAQATTATRHITVLATPGTLQSERYAELKHLFGGNLAVIDEPNTDDWARKIEDGRLADINLSALETSVANGSDTLVLACTHYIGVKDLLSERYPSTTILEPSTAIARRVSELLASTSAR